MQPQHPLPLKKALLAYFIVSLFLIFDMAVQVSPSVMATYLMRDLGLGAFALGIMSGIYFYTYTLMQIPSGIMFDRFNPRLIISASILICSLGTLIFCFANNVYMGCIARLLMGLGSACAFVSVLVVTSDVFPEHYFAFFAGVTQMVASFGAMMGQMPVSLLVKMLGWRHTMLFLGCVGLVVFVLVWTLLDYDKNKLKGTQTPRHSLTHVLSDLKVIFKTRQTWYVALYACLLWAPLSGFTSLWGVPFLIQFDHLTPSVAAFYSSLMWLGLIVSSPLVGLWSSRVSNRVFPLTLLAAIGAAAFYLLLKQPLSSWLLGSTLFIAGAACGGQGLTFVLAKENQDPHVTSTALGFNNMAVVISGAIFQPVMGKVISLSGINNYRHGSFLVLGCYIVGAIAALTLIKNPKPRVIL